MDYLPGGHLVYHLQKKDMHWNEEQVRFIVACIILGLEAMHKYGAIHRDLKPENVIFDENGYARVCDFGISTTTKESFSFRGSKKYISPEQYTHGKVERSADFYNLGLITYLCRKKSFLIKEKDDIMVQMIRNQTWK